MPNPDETSYLPSAFVRSDAEGNTPVAPKAFSPPKSAPLQIPSLSAIKALTQAPNQHVPKQPYDHTASVPDAIEDPKYYKVFRRGVSYVYCVCNDGNPDEMEILLSQNSQLRDGDSFIDNLGVTSMQDYIRYNPEFMQEGDKVSFGVREQQGIIPIYWGQIPKESDQEHLKKNGTKPPPKRKHAMSQRFLEDRAMQSLEHQTQDLRRELSEHRAKLGEKEGMISTLQAEKNTLIVENTRLKDYENRYTEARNETLEWQKKFDEKDRSCRNEIIDAVAKRDTEHKERFDIAQQALTSQINDLKDQITQLQRELNTERQNHEFTKEKVNRGDSREVHELRNQLTQLQIDMRLTVSECSNKLAQMEQQMKAREQELVYFYSNEIEKARREAEEDVLDQHKHTLGDATRNEMEVENQRLLIESFDQHLKREQEENHILKKRLRKLQGQIDQIEAEKNAKPSTTEMLMTTLKDNFPTIVQAGISLASGNGLPPNAIAGMLPQGQPAPLADDDFAEVNVAAPEASTVETTPRPKKKNRRGSRGGRNRTRRNGLHTRYDPDYEDDEDDDGEDYEADDDGEEYEDDEENTDAEFVPSRPEIPDHRQEYQQRLPEAEPQRQKTKYPVARPPENTFKTPTLDSSITQVRSIGITTRDNRNSDYGTNDRPPQAYQVTPAYQATQPQPSAFLPSSKEQSGMIPDLSSPNDFVNALSGQAEFEAA